MSSVATIPARYEVQSGVSMPAFWRWGWSFFLRQGMNRRNPRLGFPSASADLDLPLAEQVNLHDLRLDVARQAFRLKQVAAAIEFLFMAPLGAAAWTNGNRWPPWLAAAGSATNHPQADGRAMVRTGSMGIKELTAVPTMFKLTAMVWG